MARKRMTMTKRKRRVPRPLKYNNGSFKLKGVFSIQTDNSGLVLGQMNAYSMTEFFRSTSGGTFSPLPQTAEVKALYDQFRPVGIKIQFIPALTEYTSIGGAGGDGGIAGQQPMLIFGYDVDNVGTISFTNLITRDRSKLKPSNKGWTMYYRVPRATLSDSGTTGAPSLKGGWNNLQLESAFLSGGIRFASQSAYVDGKGNPLVNYRIGNVLATYYLEARHRQ